MTEKVVPLYRAGTVKGGPGLGGNPPIDNGGGPPNDGDMRERVAKLEGIFPTLATKQDVGTLTAGIADSRADVIKFVSGSAIAIVAVVLSVLVSLGTFMFHQLKQPSPSVAQPPIVIHTTTPAPPEAPRTAPTK